MAKKDKKKGKKDARPSDAAEAVEAVRSAVERTFQATTEGAAGTQKRTRALVDEVAHAASRIRETIEELRILEDVKGLRREIESLARRVAALEVRETAKASAPSRPAPSKSSAKRSATAKRAAAAKPSSTAKRSASAKRAAAKRSSAAKPSSTVKRSASAKRAKRSSKPRAKPAKSSGSSS
jgi:hypothetical protein